MSIQGRDHVKFMRRLQLLGTGITRGASPPLATQSWPLPSPAASPVGQTPPRPKRTEACECGWSGSASGSQLDAEAGEVSFRTNPSPCPTLLVSPTCRSPWTSPLFYLGSWNPAGPKESTQIDPHPRPLPDFCRRKSFTPNKCNQSENVERQTVRRDKMILL